MKIATRVRPSGQASMLCTTPSAGEITRPAPTVRSGSRKNHSIPALSAEAGTAATAQARLRRARAVVATAVSTVGTSQGEAPRASVTRGRFADRGDGLRGIEDLCRGGPEHG